VQRALIDFVARFNETGTGAEGSPIVRDPYEDFAQYFGTGILANRSSRTGLGRMATPINEPSLYRKGVTVRQNWAYSTQRVGIPNIVEYAFGLDPSASSQANLPTVGKANEGGIDYVTYTYTAVATDVTVIPQIATALGGPWNTAGSGILVETVGNTTTIKIPASLAGAFLRVQVTP